MILQSAYGASGSPLWGIVQDAEHRDVEVLMLYPLDLVAADERFGSWMTQYGYANYITQEKLRERGEIRDCAVWIAGRRFTTVAALFEPFPSEALLQMLHKLAASGGRVIWSGPPPLLTFEGGDALASWQDLFGVRYPAVPIDGMVVPGRIVEYEGALDAVTDQVILSDLFVDRAYPVEPVSAEAVARVQESVVGTLKKAGSSGSALYLGYRPRDDQSASLGYETRNWFEILDAMGAYPSSEVFDGVRDNTEFISRTTDYLACRFPNGAVAVARHLKDLAEDWPGGFARNREEDAAWLESHTLPTDVIELDDFKVNGHSVTYSGRHGLVFRMGPGGDLIAFAGIGASEVTVDGRTFRIADKPLEQVAWAPVPEVRRVNGGAVLQVMVYGSGRVRIPRADLPADLRFYAQGSKPGSKGEEVPAELADDVFELNVPPAAARRWIYGCPE
jgi:hypothetical protein